MNLVVVHYLKKSNMTIMLRKSVKTKGSVLNHRKIAVAPNF